MSSLRLAVALALHTKQGEVLLACDTSGSQSEAERSAREVLKITLVEM